MTEAHKRRILLALMVVNIAWFGGWIGREELLRGSQTVRFGIEGYDPRDLLSGHYIRFRLTAEREALSFFPATLPENRALTFCVAPSSDGLMHVTSLRAAPYDCERFLTGRVTPDGGRVDFGLDRFYVDERRASAQVLPGPNTYLEATLVDGAVHPVDLVVQGASLRRP